MLVLCCDWIRVSSARYERKKEKAVATSQCWMSLTEGVIGVLSLVSGFLFLFLVIQSSPTSHDFRHWWIIPYEPVQLILSVT